MRIWLPVWETLDIRAVIIAAAAMLALFRFHMLPTLAAAAGLGLLLHGW
jgi:hypothetical protein